jgi:hypothetical protein
MLGVERRSPLANYILAHFATLQLNRRMVRFINESQFWGLEWILGWKLQFQDEKSARIGRVGGSEASGKKGSDLGGSAINFFDTAPSFALSQNSFIDDLPNDFCFPFKDVVAAERN